MNGLGTLDATLRDLAHERDWSGAVLLTRAGTTLFEGCYGLADRAAGLPVTPATRFALASVTKSFTAAAVAALVAQGRLTFDTRVVDVVAPERRPSTLLPEVTVHHLLTHTSGIADYCEEDEDHPSYLEDYGDLWDERPCYRVQRPLDFLPIYGDLPPYRPPGGPWQYSNAGYVLLGQVVEDVTGRPYADVVQENVFDRVGMNASGFFRLDEAVPDLAVNYLPRESPEAVSRTNVYRVPVVGGADGGAQSTLADLDRYLTALADGSLLGDLRDVVLARHADAGYGFAYGYGVLHYPDGRLGHAGGDPGVEAVINRLPDDDVNLVALANVEEGLDDVRDATLAAWRAVPSRDHAG